MTKTIWDYGVKYPYGYSKEYGSTFHTGEDWTVTDYRTDIPVTVNERTIGIAGTTGKSTGIHTHVGKWAGGVHNPPNGGGKTLGDDATVVTIDTEGKTDNGKYVRVRSQGYDWVYLHLNSVNVKVGDKLTGQGDDMSQAQVDEIYKNLDAINKRLDADENIFNLLDATNKSVTQLYDLLDQTNKRLDKIEGK